LLIAFAQLKALILLQAYGNQLTGLCFLFAMIQHICIQVTNLHEGDKQVNQSQNFLSE